MKVEVMESTLVAPSEETPRQGQGLWLSNLDLAVPKTHTPLVYYYVPGPGPDSASVGRKRRRRRRLLLAGPAEGGAGQGAGALLPAGRASRRGRRRAAADRLQRRWRALQRRQGRLRRGRRLREVRALAGGQADVRALAPSGDPPCLMSMFQVTFLKCGGVVLGTGIHHVTMDGMDAFHFIQTWTGLARGLPVSEACPCAPSHDRTLLRARSPPTPELEHPVYSPAFLNGTPHPFVTRVYAVSLKLLAGLKAQCAPGASKYGAVMAHLWRCMCVARGLAQGSDTRLRVPANIRHRVRPPLPRQLFANAIVRDLVTAKAGDVVAQPLGFVADAIRKAVEHVDDAYVRSVVDYLEMESDKGSNAARGQLMPESDLWVVSWLGMPMYDARADVRQRHGLCHAAGAW